MEGKFRKSKYGNSLYMTVPLFEEKLSPYRAFCGQPHMYLLVWEIDNALTATLGIGDLDDFDYRRDFENPTIPLIHELINWLKDHENAKINDIGDVGKIINSFYWEGDIDEDDYY